MYKKIISLLIILTMIIGGTPAFAATFGETNHSTNSVLSISDDVHLSSKNISCDSVAAFNKMDLKILSEYKLLSLKGGDIAEVNTHKLVELIDNGATIYVEDSDVSLKEISRLLNLDEPDDRFVSGAQVIGAFVFNINNNYCFGITGVVECEPVDWNSLDEPQENNKSLYEPVLIGENGDRFDTILSNGIDDVKLNADDFLDKINDFRHSFIKNANKELKEDVVYMQLPAKGFNGSPYYNYFVLKSSNYQFGSATISQYRYDICVYKEGGINKAITDVVSNFTISPISNLYVNNYFARMHANISNMNIIGQSYLNSDSSSSYTLSGGFSTTSNNVLTGTIGASTTNTYSTNNQTIQNDFINQKYKNWNPTPTKKWNGASWEIEPCIRIINNNASNYKNQAYSSFQSGGWIGVLNVWGYTIPTVEVGGAW